VLLGGLVVCALVVGIVAIARHRDRPTAGHPFAGFPVASSRNAVPLGRTYLAGGQADLPPVTVLAVEPLLARGSAPAAVSLVACEPVAGSGIWGAGPSELGDVCARTRSLDHLDLSTLSDDDYLLTVVVPLADGPVRVDGAQITFRRKGVRGQQTIRGRITMQAGRCPPSGFDPLVDSVVGPLCDDTKPSDS
jgi:hypothetical protein